jgi:hypothetical protein
MATLPVLAQRWGFGLDSLRAFVRTNPHLSKLGQRIGANRAFTEMEGEAIRAAFLARREKQKPAPCGAA